jgi:enoyl-CoA hydratase
MPENINPLVITRVEERGAGRVAYITVSNPGQRNALGRRGKEELAAAFTSLAQDDQLRVAVLTGAGDKSFIAGANLAEMKDLDLGGAEDVSTKTHLACDAVRRLPVPVIARINGYCLGFGMELAAACDMRVGVETAKFGMLGADPHVA